MDASLPTITTPGAGGSGSSISSGSSGAADEAQLFAELGLELSAAELFPDFLPCAAASSTVSSTCTVSSSASPHAASASPYGTALYSPAAWQSALPPGVPDMVLQYVAGSGELQQRLIHNQALSLAHPPSHSQPHSQGYSYSTAQAQHPSLATALKRAAASSNNNASAATTSTTLAAAFWTEPWTPSSAATPLPASAAATAAAASTAAADLAALAQVMGGSSASATSAMQSPASYEDPAGDYPVPAPVGPATPGLMGPYGYSLDLPIEGSYSEPAPLVASSTYTAAFSSDDLHGMVQPTVSANSHATARLKNNGFKALKGESRSPPSASDRSRSGSPPDSDSSSSPFALPTMNNAAADAFGAYTPNWTPLVTGPDGTSLVPAPAHVTARILARNAAQPAEDDCEAPAAKRAAAAGSSGRGTSSASPLPMALVELGGNGKGSSLRKVRHKQTEDVRRHRINNAIEELRELLGLEPRTDKASILETAKEMLITRQRAPAPRLELPGAPRVAMFLMSTTEHALVDVNEEVLKRLRLSRDMLPARPPTNADDECDKSFVLPGIAPVVCGIRQAVTVCKRFRDTQGNVVWGRFTLTRTLANNKVYMCGVGQFLDRPPGTALPYYIF